VDWSGEAQLSIWFEDYNTRGAPLGTRVGSPADYRAEQLTNLLIGLGSSPIAPG
jgi:hypothetical protein